MTQKLGNKLKYDRTGDKSKCCVLFSTERWQARGYLFNCERKHLGHTMPKHKHSKGRQLDDKWEPLYGEFAIHYIRLHMTTAGCSLRSDLSVCHLSKN